ncbi:hypothetical protein EBT16_01245 [bacterium]|nr:hypothetical protein [bacterium]
MIDLKYIVAGTGRCGTLFMANLLTSMGFPCTHEAIFTPEGLERAKRVIGQAEPAVSSRISRGENLSDYELDIVAESSYMSAPFLKKFDAKVIHVVRNPSGVVASMIGDSFKNFTNPHPTHIEDFPDHLAHEEFMYEHVDELRQEMSQIDRCCLFYIRWNEMIEKSGRVAIRHRIEDGTDELKELFGFKGKCYDNTKCNSLPSSTWSFSDIQSKSIKNDLFDMMSRYGYKNHKIH